MDVNRITFDGLDAVEIVTPQARMVVVIEVGPRIAFWGKPGGENLLYWKNNESGRADWRLRGGHRVWVTRPGADEAEDAYAVDNDRCILDVYSDYLVVKGGEHAGFKIQRGLRIRQQDEATFEVTSFVTNTGDLLYSGGVWALTCTNPNGGKSYGIPLGDPRRTWDVFSLVIPRRWAGHTARVNDPQIRFNENFMIIDPQGVETKRMVQAPLGIMVMTWPVQGVSFIKYSPYEPTGQYPLGCNLSFYIGPDNFMLEMESCAPEQTLLPGQTIENPETWKLVNEVYDWQEPEMLMKLFNL